MRKHTEETKFDIFLDSNAVSDDFFGLTLKEVDDFLCDCERSDGQLWIPFGKEKDLGEQHFFHIINTIYCHGYIVCYAGEMYRDEKGRLQGTSTLIEDLMKEQERRSL